MAHASEDRPVATATPLSQEMRQYLETRYRALQQEKSGIEEMLGKKRKHVKCSNCQHLVKVD